MRAELLALVDAASIALDAGDTEVAKARLHLLAEAVRARLAGPAKDGRPLFRVGNASVSEAQIPLAFGA